MEILQVLYLIYLIIEWDDETELISLEVNQKNKYLFAELQIDLLNSLAEFIEIEVCFKEHYRIFAMEYTGGRHQ